MQKHAEYMTISYKRRKDTRKGPSVEDIFIKDTLTVLPLFQQERTTV
jgi:hypothetical protein